CKITGFYRFPLIGEISGRVDLFQPSERSERGQSEGLGIIPATGLHLASVSEKQKNKAELNLYLNK
ncbi:TPA: hypothetical protein ACH73G_004762, partial [Escherichia coli]